MSLFASNKPSDVVDSLARALHLNGGDPIYLYITPRVLSEIEAIEPAFQQNIDLVVIPDILTPPAQILIGDDRVLRQMLADAPDVVERVVRGYHGMLPWQLTPPAEGG